MMENDSIDFAKRKGKSDEWFTPNDAILPILKYIKPNSIIWCPFDITESNFVKIFENNGYKVICSHIDNGGDFFKYEPENYDIIISNPPYSLRNDILKRLFDLSKPFAMLMNTNGLFDSKIRWNLFKNNNFSLMYLSGRVNYMKEYGMVEKSSPPFQSAYICSGLSDKQILFEERTTSNLKTENKIDTICPGCRDYKKLEKEDQDGVSLCKGCLRNKSEIISGTHNLNNTSEVQNG